MNAIIILLEGLMVLFFLHVIGHPIVNMILRKQNMPQQLTDLDSIQRLPLEFVIAGCLIYVTALVATPFKAFTFPLCIAITSIAAAFYILQHVRLNYSFKMPSRFSWIAFLGFFVALGVRVGPISQFVLGSNIDVSLHTLITYTVIKDGGIPTSVIPGYVLQTPVGVHTVLAYFSLVSGIPPEIIAFNVIVYFGAAIGLAAYLFGSIISSQKFGMYLSLVLISFSFYPSGITWGSDWLVFGLLIFFVAFSVIFAVCFLDFQKNLSWVLLLLLPGIITGFLASTYIPLYIALALISALLIFLGRKNIIRRFSNLVITFVFGIPLFAIWIFRYFFVQQNISTFVSQQISNMIVGQSSHSSLIFLPFKDMTSLSVVAAVLRNWLTWDYEVGWPGSLVFISLLIAGCVLVPFLYFLNRKVRLMEGSIFAYLVSVVIFVLLWGLNSPVGLFYYTKFGFNIMASELDKVAPITGTIFLPAIAAVTLVAIDNGLGKIIRKIRFKKVISSLIVFSILLGSILVAFPAQGWLVGNYNVFATATSTDYSLLQWMHSNIPSNSVVLVNPFDAGQYVPSIGQQKVVAISSTGVIFPTVQYENLFVQIYDQPFSSTTIQLLVELKINYIFVGAKAFQGQWTPSYFQRYPEYFSLVKNFGLSYLFAFKS